ncbi:MAG: hypothetical protein H0T89_29370 [Deltaproteobacteria bacterium]|nr:hypothetical protein [Deltaproteobacteria bacterium]MDQ3369834.1 hypothetical protein [Myxococcota bacterium]
MGWFSELLRGGSDELGWDDLIRRVVDEIARLKRFGARGEVVFPIDVVVRITVGEGSVATIQEFVDRPELDREVGAGLANRCDVALDQLPRREYVVSAADRTVISVVEGAPQVWRFVIEGGDRTGATLSLPAGWSEAAFGRGEWHGGDQHARNDLILCDQTEYVSRRAGRLYRAGHLLEVASLDQADLLIVKRASGEAVRPSRTARGRAAVRPGDAIELTDGRGGIVRILVQRQVAGMAE